VLRGEVTGTEVVNDDVNDDAVGDGTVVVINAVVGDSANSSPFRLTMVYQFSVY